MRFKRPRFQASFGELLEDRSMLSGTPLDLDLSAVPTQTVFAGQTLEFNLGDLGATVSEGEDGPRTVMYQLDPDGDERPEGMSMTFSGDFLWTPTAEQEGLYSVKIIAVENGKPVNADVEELMIDVRVGRPVVDLNGEDQEGIDYNAVLQLGHGPVSVVDADLSVSDENDATLQSATITLTNRLDGADESLSVNVEGTNISVEYSEDSILLTGEDTAENYAQVLRSLIYNNTSLDADPTSRIVEITISDGEYDSHVATATIAVNHAPDLQPIADQTVGAGQSVEVVVTATDKNEADELFLLLDVESPDFVTLTQEPGAREATLAIAPGAEVMPGEYVIRVLSIDQHGMADAETFLLTIAAAANTAPTITPIDDQTIDQDNATDPLAFSIGDAESAVENLTVSVASDNPDLVDPAGIIVTGEGADKTLVVTPLAGAFGTATITLSVSDGEETTTESFVLTVGEVVANTPPTITPIDDQTIDQDNATDPLAFSIGDAESAVEDLTVSVASDNPDLVDPAGIIVTGEGADKTLVVTPLAGAFGTATITLSVSDGEETTTESFLLTVGEVVASPIAEADSFATDANTPLSVDPAGVLTNDVGDGLTVTEVNGETVNVGSPVELTSGATVTINADGSLSFDPTGNYASLGEGETAVETVSYTTTDATLGTATADVEITITGVNDAPVATDDAYATESDTALSLTVSGVLANDTDIDNGDTLTVTAVNGAAENVGQSITLESGAVLTLNADGSMTFDPSGQFGDLAEPATVSFSYTVADSHGLTSEANVTVTVSAPSGIANQNAAPINSVPGEQSTDNATPLVFDEANGNAISVSDGDAADAMVEVTVSVDNGLLTLANGFESFRHKLLGSIDQINSLLNGLVYTPSAGFEGTATLTLVTDDLGNSGLGGAKADADSVLIAVAAAAATNGVEGAVEAPAAEGESIDSIVGSEDDLDDLFQPCHFA
ncbi:Ig-like domain-containing protein [Bremerella cremea]|nr:Ig-like domain-containing protein [Bremerella cremea]